VFAKHGYAFLFLFRRGDGLSSDQGHFIRDVLGREAATGGEQAGQRLMEGRLTQEHLDDVLAGMTLLKSLVDIDSGRLAIVGHSFGGELTILAAERDRTIRAAVAFAPAARRWERSAQLQERLVAAARNVEAPVLLIHAANDYSTKPAQAMAAERERVHKSYDMKIYPAVGATPREGHGAVYTDVATWESDVFRFLDQHVQRLGR
jgi:dienelactone hydrolase